MSTGEWDVLLLVFVVDARNSGGEHHHIGHNARAWHAALDFVGWGGFRSKHNLSCSLGTYLYRIGVLYYRHLFMVD